MMVQRKHPAAAIKPRRGMQAAPAVAQAPFLQLSSLGKHVCLAVILYAI